MQKLDERVVQQALRDEEIDLRHFVTAVVRRKWSILGYASLGTLAAAIYCFAAVPIYRASTTILIESQDPNVVSIQDVYGSGTRTQQYFETEFQVLTARPIVEKVAQRLNLPAIQEFVPVPPFWRRWIPKLPGTGSARKATPLDGAVSIYFDRLQVVPVPKTQLVDVTFDSRDPVLAADIANAHARAYIESHLEAKEQMTRTASEWMSGRAEELKQKLTESEQRLQAFKEKEQLLDIETGIQALPARELNDLTTKLLEAKRALSENRNTFTQVNQARGASLDDRLAIPAVNSDPLIKQFRQAYADADLRVAEVAKRYGPQHPKMRSAVAERDAAQRSLSGQVDSVMGSIRNQQDVLEGQAQSLASAVNSTKADVQSVGRKESQYRALMQEVDTNRELYALFYKRISETKESGDLASANARVIEPAEPPLAAVKPKKILIIPLAFIASAIISVMVVLIADLMNVTIGTGEEIEQKIGLPLLGLVPLIKRSRKKGKHLGREYAESGDPKFDEAIRTLRTAISLSNLDAGHKVIMVSSSCADEGKTSIACNLALAFAQLERVLLIDADMRRPSVAGEFSLGNDRAGLGELCAGTAGAVDCIARLENEKLDVMTAGTIHPNPQELLSSRRLQEVLAKLKTHYDRIIIDTSPVLAVSDALLLANRADALVYVIKADSTTIGQVKTGLQLFRRTPVAVKGVILNQVNLKKLEEYGSAYAYGTYEMKGSR
ncbi:MAG: putative uncharacterized protein involved in exopolysaccharide biosynthesis [Verrucomicrobiaceae bacterium]|nr:putative uncharacterized protein involved in exopolysaccharide biosynthesis [Verrucomicrobiaceae bacterium]